MARIIKYRIIGELPEDDTFITTKHTITESVLEVTNETDEVGNIISARRIPEVKSNVSIKEGISAIGAISKKPVKVVILETDEGLTEEGLKEATEPLIRQKPFRIS